MSIYTPAEQYIIECLKHSKHPSNHKVSRLGDADPVKVYNHVYNCSTPKCKMCENDARFISLKKGFGKFCSKDCHTKYLSEHNRKNNKKRNEKRSIDLFASRKKELELAETEYRNNTTITIDELAEKYQIPKGAIRYYLADKGLTDSRRSGRVRAQNIENQFSSINAKLQNENWVDQRIKEGWSGEHFADYLGCSKNYVCQYLRNLDRPLKHGFISSQEQKIAQFLNDLNIPFNTNTRKIITPYELDIYLPDYKLAIEVNGVYWHNDENKPSDYHFNKTSLCEKHGIQLLHFFDVEINHKWDLVKSIILNYLRRNETIYARKCSIDNIQSKEYKNFCDINHIQGSVNASVKLGLFFEDELIAIMSFAKPRFNKNYEYELIRYCGKMNTNIVGGPSKLYKHFIREYNPKSIISYAQRRLFSGSMYNKLGMNKTRVSNPNYMWINKEGRSLTRYQTQKHKITFNGDIRTENDIMKQLGYFKIFDSGQFVFTSNPD